MAALVLLAFVLPALACNLPTGTATPPSGAGDFLRETLAAMEASSLPPGATPPTGGPPVGTAAPPPATVIAPRDFPPAPPGPFFHYVTQSGDTLTALALRFGVEPWQIESFEPLPAIGYLPVGRPLTIADNAGEIPYAGALMPDRAVIYSPTAVDFDVAAYVQAAGGFLAGYAETVGEEPLTGAEIVERVAVERSIHPRILLAVLEHRAGWVYGEPRSPEQIPHPIGFYAAGYSGLYKELTLAANHLNIPYYRWRVGEGETLRFRDGTTARADPRLNAGSVAVQGLFSRLYDQAPWTQALYGEGNFFQQYWEMFGDPWTRGAGLGPLLHPGVEHPDLALPFAPGERWSFTGGPHRVLNLGSPLGALDFSPVTGEAECAVSPAWVTASAGGIITRSRDGIVTIDLDGDGHEGTGWVLFHLHIAAEGRVPHGATVDRDDPIGHPSCEGGTATGTHVHIGRKYNGEWLAADGPLPFRLSGWRAHLGERIYEGTLTKDGQVVHANPGGSQTSIIVRAPD